MPGLLPSLKELIKSASIAQAVQPDTYYLSRFQDRILWIQIMEASHSYCIVNVKGLELQETSCHTQEAQYIDDTFELDFENPYGANSNSESKTKILKINKRPFNCMRSRDILIFQAYSDAKNSLVGILDYPENLEMLFTIYPKVLHFFLFKHLINKEETDQTINHIPKVEISRNLKSSRISIKSEYDIQMDSVGHDDFKDNLDLFNKAFEQNTPRMEKSANFSAITKKDIVINNNNIKNDKKNSSKKIDDYSSFDEWSDENNSDYELNNKKFSSKPSKSSNTQKNKNENLNSDPFDFDLNEIIGKMSRENSKNKIESKKNSLIENTNINSFNQKNEIELKPQLPKEKITKHVQSPKQHITKYSQDQSPRTFHSILTIPNEWSSFLSENLNSSQSINNENLKKSITTKKWLQKLFDLTKSLIPEKEKTFTDYENNLWTSHYKFLLKCCQILNIKEKSISLNFNSESIYNLYRGELPWSPTNEKLSKDYPQLKNLLIKSFRYAIKMIIDHATISPITDDEEFFETLESYEQEWFIGSENDPEFSQNICNNKPFIFSLHRDLSKKTLNSRTLSMQQIRSPIAQLNSEIVKSIWSSTNLELLYMTNDDEERYSIQAHPYILRNLTIQSSDPPLGYSVFNSENIYLSLANPF